MLERRKDEEAAEPLVNHARRERAEPHEENEREGVHNAREIFEKDDPQPREPAGQSIMRIVPSSTSLATTSPATSAR